MIQSSNIAQPANAAFGGFRVYGILGLLQGGMDGDGAKHTGKKKKAFRIEAKNRRKLKQKEGPGEDGGVTIEPLLERGKKQKSASNGIIKQQEGATTEPLLEPGKKQQKMKKSALNGDKLEQQEDPDGLATTEAVLERGKKKRKVKKGALNSNILKQQELGEAAVDLQQGKKEQKVKKGKNSGLSNNGAAKKTKRRKVLDAQNDHFGSGHDSVAVSDDGFEEKQSDDVMAFEKEEAGELRGLKKWIAEYNAKRPGFAVLQQQIDSFIADYEEREERARKEREAAAAEDGWTVVVHHKGRKKTTDAASGVKVGAVAAAAAANNAPKKEKNETAVDFYRFQRREARRNEVLELQKKFEDDKKRIAQMRAARKFRPY